MASLTLIAGCSSSGTSDAASDKGVPEVVVPSEPPPSELVVNVLDEGDGPALEKGDKFVIQFVGVNYETGKPFETHWGKKSTFYYYDDELIEAWETGLEGMKVGERRELVVP